MITRNLDQMLTDPKPFLKNSSHMCAKEERTQDKRLLYEVQPIEKDKILTEDTEDTEE